MVQGRKKIILLLLLSLFFAGTAKAGLGDNFFGWAWSSNTGWISFNNAGYDDYTRGGGGQVDYGVSVDINTGVLSGSAWSENVGWISFNEDSLAVCPVSPCQAKMDIVSNEISGWARVCSVFASGCSGDLAPYEQRGGWNGWIRLRGDGYGLWADSGSDPMQVRNWAWADYNIGWISFNCANTTCSEPLEEDNYKVLVSLNFLPYPTDLAVKTASCPAMVYFEWRYHDPEADLQDEYLIEADDDPGFSSPEVFQYNQSVEDGSLTNSFYIPVLAPGDPDDVPEKWKLYQNTTYHWRIKIKDEQGNWSLSWLEGPDFTTVDHKDPSVNYSWTPTDVSIGEQISIITNIVFYDGVCSADPDDPVCAYSWTIPADAEFIDPTTSTDKEPIIQFNNSGIKQISLQATDSTGRSCLKPKMVNVDVENFPPKWWESSPF